MLAIQTIKVYYMGAANERRRDRGSTMSTLAQEFAFVSNDVHDFARRYVSWAQEYSKGIIGHYGRDWRETAPEDVREIGAAAALVRDNPSKVKRDILEEATRARCLKSDAEIQATYDQMEADMYRRNKRRHRHIDITVDFDLNLNPNPRTMGTILDTLCEDTATVDNRGLKHSVASVRAALVTVNVKAAECFDAVGRVDWDAERVQPNLVQLARALGVTRNPARKRWQTLDRILRSDDFAAMVV